jgi:hypothetical protein
MNHNFIIIHGFITTAFFFLTLIDDPKRLAFRKSVSEFYDRLQGPERVLIDFSRCVAKLVKELKLVAAGHPEEFSAPKFTRYDPTARRLTKYTYVVGINQQLTQGAEHCARWC